jgi:hypothetical protein
MATEFRSLSIPIPGGSGTKVVEDSALFGASVLRADSAIKSFLFDYSSSDHHINVIEVTTSVIATPGPTARVRVVCRYADQNFDDAYSGHVRVLVVADVA